jgi:hypothetical protein
MREKGGLPHLTRCGLRFRILAPPSDSSWTKPPASKTRVTSEGVAGKNKEGKELSFVALATTTYVKRGNDWLITTHHASAMPT